MGIPKFGKSKKGKDMHYSVGAVIQRKGKYLLVDRATEPFGFASVAGHIDENETPLKALIREIGEESGLRVKKCILLFEEEVEDNVCSRGTTVHRWHVYECETVGEPEFNEKEAKGMGWYTRDEIAKLELEPIWRYWFKKLKIL